MKMFKVYKSIVSNDLIDSLIASHEKFKGKRSSYFRSQGTLAFEKPIIDELGNQINSIQNPHLLGISNEFSSLVKNIIYSDEIFQCVKDFMGSNEITHYQSMFFDRSTATAMHQDTWYLDTTPAGGLIGVWIALEDIKADAGSFYIYSDFVDRKLSSVEMKASINSKFNFFAKKGDVLVWNSFAIHGADKPISNFLTRKSLTAHFYPTGAIIQDPPIKRPFSIYDHQNPGSTSHSSIKSATTFNPFLYQLMCISLAKLGKFSSRLTGDHTANKVLSEIRNIEK